MKDGSTARHVVAVRGNLPLIEKNGKLVEADSGKYLLEHVPEFEPLFISVHHLKVSQFHLETQSGSELNHNFEFYAEFESPFRLQRVFLVLELRTTKAGKLLFIREIGTLAPRDSEPLSWEIPLNGGLGDVTYRMHLFVGGLEVLNSQMPWEVREAILDRMVAKRTQGAADRPPQPFVGPAPEYPSALRKAKISGRVTVYIRVGIRGNVSDPKVVSASDPAFGAAALEAIRQWRFLPKVSSGIPTAVGVNMPMNFTP